MESIESDKGDLIIEIPHGFEKKLVKENKAAMLIAVNAVNGAKANLGGALQSISFLILIRRYKCNG